MDLMRSLSPVVISVGFRGGARGNRPPSLIFRPNWGPKGRKKSALSRYEIKQRLQLGFASVPFFIFPFSVLRISTSSFLAQKLVDLSLREPNDETVTKGICICTAIKMNISLQGTIILFYLRFLQHFAITRINPVYTAVNSFTSWTVKFYKTYAK